MTGEREELERLAEKERQAWLRGFRREERRGNAASAEACLIGANAIDQLMTRYRRAMTRTAEERDNGR